MSENLPVSKAVAGAVTTKSGAVVAMPLGLESQQIVRPDGSADGRLAVKRAVAPMPIVVVQPALERGRAVRRRGVVLNPQSRLIQTVLNP